MYGKVMLDRSFQMKKGVSYTLKHSALSKLKTFFSKDVRHMSPSRTQIELEVHF